MAKNAKKRKSGVEKQSPIVKKAKQDTEAAAAPAILDVVKQAGMIGGLVYEDELETTTDTLLLLAQNPSLIGLKALKPFKTAVHDYWRIAHEATNTGALAWKIKSLSSVDDL